MHHGTHADLLADFVASHRLPRTFGETASRWFLPLADELKTGMAEGTLRVLGITGTQGSGKSTLASLLERCFNEIYGLRVVSLSLDDFYLTRSQRRQLADRVHPLLKTRGVPGTHDLPLALDTINSLLSRRGETAVPRFDKARDDRKPEADWDRVAGPVDAVILEGWCLGAIPENNAALAAPINRLEAEEDPRGHWRTFVNHCLESDYPALFRIVDKLVVLQAPDFQCVYHWRRRQERKLSPDRGDRIMSDEDLRRFVQHFERITRHSLATLPETADVIFQLDAEQRVVSRRDNRTSCPGHAERES